MKLYNYERIGKGMDVILLHGFAMNSIFLKSFAKQLGQYYQVHLFDLPGFGAASHIHLPDQMQMLSKILLDNVPKKSIWIGWSLGGLIATWIARYYPEYVMRLINIASSPYFIATDHWPGIDLQNFIHFFNDLKKNYEKAWMRFLKLQMPNGSLSKLIKMNKDQVQPSLETLSAGIKLLSLDLRKEVQRLQMHCLYLLGEQDRIVPWEVSLQVASKKNIQTFVINNAAHMPFISHEKISLTLIQEFLNESYISKKSNCTFI